MNLMFNNLKMEHISIGFIERHYPGLIQLDPEAYKALIKNRIVQRLEHNPLAQRYLNLEDIRVLNEGEVEIGLTARIEAVDRWTLYDDLEEAVH